MWGASQETSPAEFAVNFPLLTLLYPLPEDSDGRFEGFSEVFGSPEDLQAKTLDAVLQARERQAQADRNAAHKVSVPSNTESLARYQAALDNEWYKAMRAFREARQYRLRTVVSE